MVGRKHTLVVLLVVAMTVTAVAGYGAVAVAQDDSGNGTDDSGMTGMSGSANFTADLEGENEVPPVETDASGQATLELSTHGDGPHLHYTLRVANIDNVTMAHIHVGAPGENGPVVAFLFNASEPVDVSGEEVLAEGTIRADDLIGPLEGMDLSALAAEIRAGNTYVNVHTVEHPSGEIRGQIVPAEDDAAAPTASVVFENQTSDRTTVVVESVTMSEGGFVAIHDTVDGGVGPVIGASQFLEAGTHTDVTVTLFELPGAEFNQSALNESQTLIAMPHLDTNGNQVYEFVSSNGAEDGPYTENGSAVVDSAFITVEEGDDAAAPTASVVFENQTTDGTTVVVESVTMSEGGFVAIHNASLLQGNTFGSVVGVSEALPAGTHENVVVTLFEGVPGQSFAEGQTLEESQTLIAMPHFDSNDNGVYDFITSNGAEDGPYIENGSAVVDSAFVTVNDGAISVCEAGSSAEVVGENDEDDDGDGAIDEDDEDPNDGPSNDDDDGDGAVDEDDECDDGDDGSDDFNSEAEDDDDGDGHFDEDDEPDSGNSDDVDNDGDGAVDEDDESDNDD